MIMLDNKHVDAASGVFWHTAISVFPAAKAYRQTIKRNCNYISSFLIMQLLLQLRMFLYMCTSGRANYEMATRGGKPAPFYHPLAVL